MTQYYDANQEFYYQQNIMYVSNQDTYCYQQQSPEPCYEQIQYQQQYSSPSPQPSLYQSFNMDYNQQYNDHFFENKQFFNDDSYSTIIDNQISNYEESMLATALPTFDQCMAGRILPKKLPQRQPSEKAMLLSLNAEKFNRWKPAVDFISFYLGYVPLFDFICELLYESPRSNKFIQWLTETQTMSYSRAFEFKNTQELIELYNKRTGQSLSYKSFANLLSLKKWTVNGVVVIQKIGKNQRNKYVLLPDLVKNDFGGKGISKIDFDSAGKLVETFSS